MVIHIPDELVSEAGKSSDIEKFIVESVAYQTDKPEDLAYLIRLNTEAGIKAKKEQLSIEKNIMINDYLDGRRVTIRFDEVVHDFLSVDLVDTFLGQPLKVLIENIELFWRKH